MSLNQLHKQLNEKQVKYLFTDYYDTIVHRKVHPNYTLRIWAKLMIREMGLPATIDELYFTRQESVNYLKDTLNRQDVEIPYNRLQEEIYKRLLTTHNIAEAQKEEFMRLFEEIDFAAERSVQYLNQDVVDTLKYFKANGGKVYLVSDFYGSKSLFEKLLNHHEIAHLFDAVFSSAALEKSKYTGTIYSQLLSELQIKGREVMMIGDNERSDVRNAQKSGLHAFQLPHKKYLRQNKRNNFGNDKKLLRKCINALYKSCNKSDAIPYTEYIVFYHVFIERLYEKCRKTEIKDLFFLSREGQYLKKLFDSYQDHVVGEEDRKIRTHYLKISRQASLQIALRPVNEETFGYLQTNYKDISMSNFLSVFNCSEELKKEIINDLNIDGDEVIHNFFKSTALDQLKSNNRFVSFYDDHRQSNRDAFQTYINAFDADVSQEGMHLADIGWGGTMQESIFKYFQQTIAVTGYYLGLGDIYNIAPKTKRFGLIFSLMPYKGYDDQILMANMQLYEQFSAADHGSALGYDKAAKDFTLEYHKPEEKWLYDNHIKAHQDAMFKLHKQLLRDLECICYDNQIMQKTISDLALKVGLFQSSRKLKFLNTLSQGFYQNIGNNKVGLTYERPKIKSPLRSMINFLLTPEKYFRYLVKLKAAVYNKNKLLAFLLPMYIVYLYFKINRYIRFRILNQRFLLKYNFFK